MIQGLIIKKVMDIVMKQLLKQFNLDKIQKYVEQPNDLDKKVKSIEKKLKKLENLAHPVADFVCTDCGTKAKRVKSKLNKLKERF
jgi:nicotinic acid mononucleotide adenylyltransferase